MAGNRIASKRYEGVYYRESTGRKHRGKPDRTYSYTLREAGQKKYIHVGRASENFTEEIAYKLRLAALSKINKGETVETFSDKKNSTLDKIMTAYLDWRKGEKKHTIQEQSRYDKHIKPVFGALPIAHITTDRLGKFKDDKLTVLSPASVKKLFVLMRAAINRAIRAKIYKGPNPVDAKSGFSPPEEDNKSSRFLTKDEAEKLLAELEKRSTQLYHMAYVALYTGLRPTEIFGLKGVGIDENTSSVTFKAKSGKMERVHIHKKVLDILLRYRTSPDALLFPDTNGNRYQNVPDTFGRAVKALGMDSEDNKQRVIFHTLRHTYASWLAQSGQMTLVELKTAMRHRRIETTMRYIHLIPGEQHKKAAAIINGLMPE